MTFLEVAWPSGKAEACKASIPSSNLGATFFHFMLYLVATPIGNLADITFRAVETLKNVDYILCEDTRHSRPLLGHYEIQTPLRSYHKFNLKEKEREILSDLAAGKKIALISDAGTPGISDPGAELVAACVQHGFAVQAIPGPCAAIAALVCSGFNTSRFQFRGFLPRKENELKREIHAILNFDGTTIAYESAQRIEEVLSLLNEVAPSRKLAIARELTKKFEEIVRGSAAEILSHFQTHPLKGELVLLIEKGQELEQDWLKLSPVEHVEYLEKTYQLTRADALKLAAKQRGVSKRDIYREFIS